MVSMEQIKDRYCQNLESKNWPEARYEWDLLNGHATLATNPFDEVDDKLIELVFFSRSGDFKGVTDTLEYIHLKGEELGGYRKEDIRGYATLIEPVTQQLEKLDESKDCDDYQGGLEIIRQLEKGRWQIEALGKIRSDFNALDKLSNVKAAARDKNYELACSLIPKVSSIIHKAEQESLLKWIKTAFELTSELIKIEQFDLALATTEHIKNSNAVLGDETEKSLASLRGKCIACLLQQAKESIAVSLKEGDLEKVLREANDLIGMYKKDYAQFWPELGRIPKAIKDYKTRIKDVENLCNEYQVDKALALLMEVPECLKSCGVEVCGSKVEGLRDLKKRRQEHETSLRHIQEKFKVANITRQYQQALHLANDLEICVCKMAASRPQLYSANELESRLSEARIQKKRAFNRAIRAAFTGEMLLQWIIRRLHG